MTFLRRLWFFLTRGRRAADLREEIELHVELRSAANRRRGLAPAEADAAAHRRFGNQLRLREESQDIWGFSKVEQAGQDVRYALRHLAKRPTWTTAIILTLAIGIAANASVLGLLDALLFRPIAAASPDRVLWLSTLNLPSGHMTNMSYPDYTRFRDASTSLSGLAAYSGNEFSLGSRPAARVFGDIVSGNYFDVLGVGAALGRMLRPDDDRPGNPPVVVLSDVLWKERFRGDPSVVNTAVAVNGQPFTVVGIAPPGFVGAEVGEDAELWVPLVVQPVAMPTASDSPTLLSEADSDWLLVLGRLRDGLSLDQARAELVSIAATLRPPGSPSKRRTSVVVAPATGGLAPSNRKDAAPVLGLISIAPLLVLLVACSNVGNVIIADNVARRREFAMRRAIGASRGRLIRQLLVEALLLALVAASAGFALSFALTRLIGYLGNIPGPDLETVLVPNVRILAATTALAIATVLVFGLVPAMAAARLDLMPVLKEQGSRGPTAPGRLRSAFVVVQVAMSLALLIAAGLFLQSLGKALRVDTGFDARGAATLSFDLALQAYPRERQALFVHQLLDRSASLPGVTSTAVTSMLPLSGVTRRTRVLTADSATSTSTLLASISPGYFETMRTSLSAGRAFAEGDPGVSPPVAIVNETLARRLWPDQRAVGQRLRLDGARARWLDVIAVVRNGKYGQLTESPQAALFVPLAQRWTSPLSLVVRSAGSTSDLTRSLATIVATLDPDLPVYRLEPLQETVRRVASLQQAAASLLGVLGLLTLLLAAIGLYGVAAHSASLRVREVGLRIALGARGADVVRLFVKDGLRLAAVGIAAGLGISAAASRLLTSFLFGLTATDAMTFVMSAGILCAVTALASYLPASRAAGVDPAVVLKQD